MKDQFNKDYRFQSNALLALQEACEHYLVGLLEDTYFVCHTHYTCQNSPQGHTGSKENSWGEVLNCFIYYSRYLTFWALILCNERIFLYILKFLYDATK